MENEFYYDTVQDTNEVVGENDKEKIIRWHNEKLAVLRAQITETEKQIEFLQIEFLREDLERCKEEASIIEKTLELIKR